MIRKSGNRSSDKIMLTSKESEPYVMQFPWGSV
jgi:hypothetical protein